MVMLPSRLSYLVMSDQAKGWVGRFLEKSKYSLSPLVPQKVTIAHSIPGRIRLQCKQWKSKNVTESLESKLKKHPFVEDASLSSITGTLLLRLKVPYLTKAQLKELIQFAVDSSYT